MPLPTADLLILSEVECRELLSSVEIGRVITSVEALPAAFPVNFRVIDNKVVFRTRAGAKFDAALNNTVVGFEVDDVDPSNGSAWSVLVVGRSEVVTDPDAILLLDRHDIRSWAGARLPHYVVVNIDRLSGRRVPGPSAD